MADEDWITTTDAARLLGVTRQRVGVLARTGKIEARLLSPKLWLVRRAAVEQRKVSAKLAHMLRCEVEAHLERTTAPRTET